VGNIAIKITKTSIEDREKLREIEKQHSEAVLKNLKDQMENSSDYPFLSKIHQKSVGNHYKKIECDVVI